VKKAKRTQPRKCKGNTSLGKTVAVKLRLTKTRRPAQSKNKKKNEMGGNESLKLANSKKSDTRKSQGGKKGGGKGILNAPTLTSVNLKNVIGSSGKNEG